MKLIQVKQEVTQLMQLYNRVLSYDSDFVRILE